MPAQELLLGRLQALLTQLDQLKVALGGQGLDANLRKRMGPLFDNEIADQRKRLKNDIDAVKRGVVNRLSWGSLRDREDQCKPLFGECLAYLQAARARGAEADAKLCGVADALLDELNAACELNWRRFIILAGDESFSDRVQIIRMRFPFSGVWDLPVAAHEFGHFAAFRVTAATANNGRSLLFREYLDRYLEQHPDLGEEWNYYLNEFFSDIFATFVLGPSYACTSLLLRFTVADVNKESDQRHPSYAKRAFAILETLRRMNSAEGTEGHFSDVLNLLKSEWAEALLSAKVETALSPEVQNQIGAIARDIFWILHRGCRNARYTGWQTALTLHFGWQANDETVAQKPAIRDLLNAAWLARLQLQPGNSSEPISSLMLSLC
jgi:hypothetical protein